MGVHDVPTMFCTMFGYLRDDNIRMFNLTPDNLRYTLFMTIFLSPTGIIKFSMNFIIPPHFLVNRFVPTFYKKFYLFSVLYPIFKCYPDIIFAVYRDEIHQTAPQPGIELLDEFLIPKFFDEAVHL
jgi:hypothetical protein